MSALVSTLAHIGPAGGRYAFLLMAFSDYESALTSQINIQKAAFGKDLGPAGIFIEPYPEKKFEIASQLLSKTWPEDVKVQIVDSVAPFLLIIDKDWQAFDPMTRNFAILWFEKFQDNPDLIRSTFQELAKKTKAGEDVIKYLHDLDKKAKKTSVIDFLRRYVQWKPKFLGIEFDGGKAIADVAHGKRTN